MNDGHETKEKLAEATSKRDGKTSLTRKVVVPLAASAVSGAAAYAARKAPGFIQETVLPKLKEATQSGGRLEKAKDAVDGVVASVSEKVGSPGGSQSQPQPQPRPRRSNSSAERERQRRVRESRRRERREALSR
jgi:hypothetical protein